MDRDALERWLEGYFAAWVSNDPTEVAGLFSEDATYLVGPFAEPWVGRDEIVRRWTAEVQEDVAYSYDVPALQGDTAVVHWNVSARTAGDSSREEWDGILLLTFGPDGRCRDHREWLNRRRLPPSDQGGRRP